jgi:hypothetical protein
MNKSLRPLDKSIFSLAGAFSQLQNSFQIRSGEHGVQQLNNFIGI